MVGDDRGAIIAGVGWGAAGSGGVRDLVISLVIRMLGELLRRRLQRGKTSSLAWARGGGTWCNQTTPYGPTQLTGEQSNYRVTSRRCSKQRQSLPFNIT